MKFKLISQQTDPLEVEELWEAFAKAYINSLRNLMPIIYREVSQVGRKLGSKFVWNPEDPDDFSWLSYTTNLDDDIYNSEVMASMGWSLATGNWMQYKKPLKIPNWVSLYLVIRLAKGLIIISPRKDCRYNLLFNGNIYKISPTSIPYDSMDLYFNSSFSMMGDEIFSFKYHDELVRLIRSRSRLLANALKKIPQRYRISG